MPMTETERIECLKEKISHLRESNKKLMGELALMRKDMCDELCSHQKENEHLADQIAELRGRLALVDEEMMTTDARTLTDTEISAIRMCRDIWKKCHNGMDQQSANAMLMGIFEVLEPVLNCYIGGRDET